MNRPIPFDLAWRMVPFPLLCQHRGQHFPAKPGRPTNRASRNAAHLA
jgi:hypothetical protein